MIKKALVGFTGFVGSNLLEQCQFNNLYNSKNIQQINGEYFDLLVCAGVSAVKWMANQNPADDIKNINNLKYELLNVKVKHFVLISTVDIYDTPIKVTEDSVPNVNQQDYYGKHRYALEEWVGNCHNFENVTVIRLPGLFGNNLKKNLVFDIMNPLPKSINKELWMNLRNKFAVNSMRFILHNYSLDDVGNLKLNSNVPLSNIPELIKTFAEINFSSLNFTDSRSEFQFYNLANLWYDIKKYTTLKVPVVNLSSEPIMASELVAFLTGKNFINHILDNPVKYDMYSKYADDGKYLYTKPEIIKQIGYLVNQGINL
jgi:hypothetical protein